MAEAGFSLRLASQGNSVTTINAGNTPDHCVLGYVNVGKAAASSTVTIWSLPEGSTSASNSTTGTIVTSIDTSATTGRAFTYMIRGKAFWANMQGGNADATITFF